MKREEMIIANNLLGQFQRGNLTSNSFPIINSEEGY